MRRSTQTQNTNTGNRPNFPPAAAPDIGEKLFTYPVEQATQAYAIVQTGRYGADIRGRVTIAIEVGGFVDAA